MHHTVALLSSLSSLGLICAIYFCNIQSRPGSWFRSDLLAMIMLALLTSLFPLAVSASVVGLWEIVTGELSLAAFLSAGADLVAIAAIVIGAYAFRAIVAATYRNKTKQKSFKSPATSQINPIPSPVVGTPA